MLAEVAKARPAGKDLGNQRPGRVRQQDLAAVTCGADPGGAMDVEPDVVVAAQLGQAGVEAHPDAHRGPIGPIGARKFALRRA